jgi:HlyD family secretion protein
MPARRNQQLPAAKWAARVVITMLSAVPSEATHHKVASIRDTSATDRPVDPNHGRQRRRWRMGMAGLAAVVILVGVVTLIRSWSSAETSLPSDRVRIATVTRGPFIRDVAAQGTVVAAVSPTLFASAPGTVHYLVRAGDRVRKDQPLASIDSPSLRNELERESATLAALEMALQRQSIETRRQLLTNQQAMDLAKLNIQAMEREQRRAEDSWKLKIISKRDYEKASDDAATASVNHQHSIETAALQKESLEFELRAKRLERDRQRLLVTDLQRRAAELDVKSPVDGMVGTLAVNERAAIAVNAPVITVVDLSALEIEFQAPESYGDDLEFGMRAEVTYAGGKYAAEVSAVAPEVKQGQVTGRLRFTAAMPQGLRQNQRLSTRILLESRDSVLKVTRGTFLDTGGGRIVYRVRDGIATRTTVETGSTSIAEVEILNGLAEGDQIIVSGLDATERERVRLTQ